MDQAPDLSLIYNMKKLLILLAFVIISTGCLHNEDDATTVVVTATPSSYIVKSGDKVYVDVYVSTLNEALKDVTVTTFDPEYGKSEIHKINPAAKSYKDRIIWEIPSMANDTTLVEVIVTATDTDEVSNSHTLILKAAGGKSSLLPERSGNTIWSPASGKQDAFSFTTLQPLYSSSEAEDCDIMFLPEENADVLPKNWGTRTDIVFCKANSFDYASATWTNLQEVFKSSLRTKTVEDIAIEDVVFVGREETTEEGAYILTTLGVIKIMAMYDEEGCNNDRIVFNLKVLSEPETPYGLTMSRL